MSNIYIAEGLLTRFEERTTPNGNRVCTFSILLPEKPPADGQPRKDGTFIPCESWDITPQLAALLTQNVKNCRVFIKGRLKLDRYKDKVTGADRQTLKCIADRVSYLPLQKKGGGNQGGNQGGYQQRPQNQQAPARSNQQGQQQYDENGQPIPF